METRQSLKCDLRPQACRDPSKAPPGRSSNIRRFAAQLLAASMMVVTCVAASEALPSTHSAVEHGLRLLQNEAFQWKETRKCAACHHAATMIWAFNEARAAGYSIDEEKLSAITSWAFMDMKTNSVTEQAPPRDVLNLGWVYVLLSAESSPEFKASFQSNDQRSPNDPVADKEPQTLFSARQTLLRQIIKKQVADGSWGHPLDHRVPLDGPAEDITILCRLALLQSGDKSKSVIDCINNAGTWLGANHDTGSRQARNFRLLMDVCEGKPAAELKAALDSIRAEQNEDGGWSQTPTMESDAYATGQALYVLSRAGVGPQTAEVKRGVEFLRRTQREDGSWPMTSRVHSKNLNPITTAGAAWAVLGLLRADR